MRSTHTGTHVHLYTPARFRSQTHTHNHIQAEWLPIEYKVMQPPFFLFTCCHAHTYTYTHQWKLDMGHTCAARLVFLFSKNPSFFLLLACTQGCTCTHTNTEPLSGSQAHIIKLAGEGLCSPRAANVLSAMGSPPHTHSPTHT